MIKRLKIIVEGQTEELFVKNILAPYLAENYDICAFPIILMTSFDRKNGKKYKGGVTNYVKIRNDIISAIKEDPNAFYSTMIDFYGLPDDFPGKEKIGGMSCEKKAECIENALKDDIDSHIFIPYVQMHEYETFLFVSPENTNEILCGNDTTLRALDKIINGFGRIEDINCSPETSPSKRIAELYQYSKVSDGNDIVKKTGIEKLIKTLPHFSKWIEKIKSFK
ncbi:MAG TPA: DUF4276 family protein [bacterium]|nr:DUF4276 family protein [bacterium]HPS31798.1 DUF4276 family protein [bacterium]